jgi:hypothetical protein
MEKRKKPTPGKEVHKFIIWYLKKHIDYGEVYTDWWHAEGKKYFLRWAMRKGYDFVPEGDDDARVERVIKG